MTVNLFYPFAKSLVFLAIAVKIQADNKNTPLLTDTRAIPPAHIPQAQMSGAGRDH